MFLKNREEILRPRASRVHAISAVMSCYSASGSAIQARCAQWKQEGSKFMGALIKWNYT